MCGICGILVYRGDGGVDLEDVVRLRDAQSHRGPDDEGAWISEGREVGLGHRRLSIIDLSAHGHQPMVTRDGRLHVVFNGEIYNFRALRRELEDAGFVFDSDSDTEVILHGWRAWGLGLLDRLRGMFAFALHDSERRETLLARDPLGIKPLYVADDGRQLVFSSEIQPIRGLIDGADIDPNGLATYLLWGSIGAPDTLYRGIRALAPGSWLRVRWDGSAPESGVYYRMEDEFGHPDSMDEHEAAERVRAALLDSVRHHLVADVPVGAFLSGGVDSSALVGLLSEAHDGAIATVTLSFDVEALDESELAREAATLYGSSHHEIRITLDDARDRLGGAIRALDQPSVDGINTYLVSEATVRAGLKVAVSGVGGDELFGGYSTFSQHPRLRAGHDRLSKLPGSTTLLPLMARGIRGVARTRTSEKLARTLYFGGSDTGAYYLVRGLFSPEESRALLAPELRSAVDACRPDAWLLERVDTDSRPVNERVSILEFRQYLQSQLLRDADATSMRHSLEVRTPLVDRELVRALACIPPKLRQATPAKRMLREAARPPVPDALWNRQKQGFTLPFEDWLRSGKIGLELPDHPCLDGDAVRRVAADFERGRLHWSRLWALLVLGEFLR
jgi:asparagine synthase (glutamine-hydrolysing)